MKKIKKEFNKYDNFEDTFKYSYIGLPKGFMGLEKPYYGQYYKIKKLLKEKNHTNKKFPLVLFIHGSSGLNKGTVYRKWIVEQGFIFICPNSLKIDNRPTYKTPDKISAYEKVHKLRQAEIVFNINKIKNFDFIDKNNIFLMGNSEGGLAAAAYKGKEFKARIITAYSCENGYYSKDFKIGAKKSDPILNIIGTNDEFFSKKSEASKDYKVEGHCTKALKKYKNAKVVILAQTKHDITQNGYVKDDIISFLRLWRKS
ncbi:hypothetical protein CP965_07895 [Halarcobacter mediterraneus]|uniref:Dienelactone hydrolase domain-containing protein n=1 Tax=Halarcobacter mediterraneus TaxID=2023153 RepID=A0A4Q1B3A5_9BACT|nr:dienelactone hydrolase family protein [Halarcobacter mediterraneus]RXK12498.1 hypothetical protein CP965_07895 [Halarcobacter mediterraneus]